MKKLIGFLFIVELILACVMTIMPVFMYAAVIDTSATIGWQKELLGNILGNKLTWVGYAGALIFTFMGLYLRWYFKAKDSIKTDPNTPDKFNFSYWLRDNLLPKLAGIMATLIIIFLSLRFATEYFGLIPSMAMAVVVGLCFDWFMDFLKKLNPQLLRNLPITGLNNNNPVQ